MLERGIRIRTIYERSVLDAPEGDAYLARWREFGEHQHLIESVPFRAAVFDQSVVLVTLAAEAAAITSLLVIRAGLGEAIASLFELLWDTPSTGATAQRDRRPMSEQEKLVLTLMCEGMSDHKIAQKLGIGVRTVQRRLGDLTALFGVASRTSLAAKSVASGEIKPFADEMQRGSVSETKDS